MTEPKSKPINKDNPDKAYHEERAEREETVIKKNIGHESGPNVVPVGRDHDSSIRRQLEREIAGT